MRPLKNPLAFQPTGTLFVTQEDGVYAFLRGYTRDGWYADLIDLEFNTLEVHHHQLRIPRIDEIPAEVWERYNVTAPQLTEHGVNIAVGTALMSVATTGYQIGILVAPVRDGREMDVDVFGFEGSRTTWDFAETLVVSANPAPCGANSWLVDKRRQYGISTRLP